MSKAAKKDMVRVIRCKDCGYYRPRKGYGFCIGLPTEPSVIRKPEDFCSKAVRTPEVKDE